MKTVLLLITTFFIIRFTAAQQVGEGFTPYISNFNAPLKSGLYNGEMPNIIGGVPDNTHAWQYLLTIRHANTNNNHQLQFGSSFAQNDKLYFRKIAEILMDGTSNWIELATRGSNFFNGDIGIGLYNDVYTDLKSYGNKLFLAGNPINSDPIWMARYNNGTNSSELRVNIGDDLGQSGDKFVVGVIHCGDQQWHPVFTVQNDRQIIADGKITATEIVVKQNVWADYVFHPSYKLKPLTEVEQFIKINGHLQDIPSAAEVQKNGVNMGEMQAKLLQKVEETTLYLIEMSKQMEILKKQNEQLQEDNETLKSKLNELQQNRTKDTN